jgi:site-specific DNA-methyltransferase (adenine-specific)
MLGNKMINFNDLPAKDKIYYQDDATVVYCADNREILPLFPDKAFDLVLTDPPYGVKFVGWDIMTGMGWLTWCREHIPLILFTSGITNMFDYPNPDWIVSWSLSNGTKHSKGGGINNWEPVLVYGKNPFMLDHKQFRSLSSQETEHPCAKPLEAWRWLILNASKPNDLILDPFLGSGTTLVAAKILGRKAIGIEISEKYCEIAAKRLSQSVMQLEIPKEDVKTETML